jgi:hypothetical protein
VTIANSRVTGNTASLTSTFPFFIGGGDFLELGVNSGGIHMGRRLDAGLLALKADQISDNVGTASAPTGTAQGGHLDRAVPGRAAGPAHGEGDDRHAQHAGRKPEHHAPGRRPLHGCAGDAHRHHDRPQYA